jgi:hypothetical protein
MKQAICSTCIAIFSLVVTMPLMAKDFSDCQNGLIYLSSTIEAYRYLEHQQREIYEANPGIRDPLSRAVLSSPETTKSWNELAAKLKGEECDTDEKKCVVDPSTSTKTLGQLLCGPLPTQFESPLTFALIKLSMDGLHPARTKYYPDSRSRVIRFGTLPTGTINAKAALVPGSDEFIVIVNRDTFAFTGAFAKAVSNAIPIDYVDGRVGLSHDPDRIRARLKENPEILGNFVEAMYQMVTLGSPIKAKQDLLDDDHNRLYARLLRSLDGFIVAHELAHVILGHVSETKHVLYYAGNQIIKPKGGTPDTMKVKGSASRASMTFVDRSKADELAADALGFRLLIQSLQETVEGSNPVMVAVAGGGAELFFGLVEIADAYAQFYGGYSMSGATHPTASERSAALNMLYSDPKNSDLGLSATADWRPLFRASLSVLKVEAEPILRALFEAKTSVGSR